MRYLRFIWLSLLLIFTSGFISHSHKNEITVRVINRTEMQFTIYAVKGPSKQRLEHVDAFQTLTLKYPEYMLDGNRVQFYVQRFGGWGSGLTDAVVVDPISQYVEVTVNTSNISDVFIAVFPLH
jgi:hypothetical protein